MAFGIDLTAGGTGFIILTFFIGLLAGVVVKRIFKLVIGIVALVILLVVAGYVNLQANLLGPETIYRAAPLLPTVVSTASQVATILPLTSAAFLVGIAIGIWKG